ncbi:MAG: hypothetical protein U0835_09120 [Isosphaeraceae bacterium]
MALSFSCPQCGKTFQTDESYAGKKCKCKQCEHIFLIPAPSAPTTRTTRPLQSFDDSPTRTEPRTAAPRPAASRPSPRPSTPPPPTVRTTASSRVDPYGDIDPYGDDDPYGLDEVAAPAKPVFPEDQDEFAPPRAPIPAARKKKKKSASGRGSGPFSGLPGTYYMVSLALMGVALLFALVSPRVGFVVFFTVGIIAAAVPAVYGWAGMIVTPFFESVGCGLMNMFLPVYPLYYLISRWEDMKGSFISYLAGIGMMILTIGGAAVLAPRVDVNRPAR